jgi:hypothetical protein
MHLTGWKAIPRGTFNYPWEKVPLEIKTIFSLKSGYRIWVRCSNADNQFIGRFNTRGSDYRIGDCQSKPMNNLPEAPDNIRTWKFTKKGLKGLSIECNGVLVAEHWFDRNTDCYSSKWLTEEVAILGFNRDWDKSDSYRGFHI